MSTHATHSCGLSWITSRPSSGAPASQPSRAIIPGNGATRSTSSGWRPSGHRLTMPCIARSPVTGPARLRGAACGRLREPPAAVVRGEAVVANVRLQCCCDYLKRVQAETRQPLWHPKTRRGALRQPYSQPLLSRRYRRKQRRRTGARRVLVPDRVPLHGSALTAGPKASIRIWLLFRHYCGTLCSKFIVR